MAKPTVYLETSVVSYYAAWPSRDVIILAHQQITRDWWEKKVQEYDIFISQLVVNEVAQGDANAAKRRLEVIERFPLLVAGAESEDLTGLYLQRIPLLENAARDAAHVAIASQAGMDYLLTWNCRHIARAEVRRAIEQVNESLSLETPMICTPEELLGEDPYVA